MPAQAMLMCRKRNVMYYFIIEHALHGKSVLYNNHY